LAYLRVWTSWPVCQRVAQYRLFGLAALARKKRGDQGERRAVSTKMKEVVEGLALQKPPLPVAALYRQVLRFSKDLGEKAPSYGTVFNIVHSLGADLVTLAHEGTKAYSNTFELVHRSIAEGCYRRGTPQDTTGRNFVPKPDLTR
jgi:putative transposase